MDSSISYDYDGNIESHHSTQVLEMAYQETLRNGDLIIKDESARRLRLRILLLENENDELHEQLALADDRIDGLEQEVVDVQTQLELAQGDSSRNEAELRSQNRELKILKAELTSMNGVNMDSTKLLTEKLALSRELAILKPEIEHLRSQSVYQQTILSEKLALQRQVSTLEVELETEKRASKRAMEKNKNKEREVELQQQVDDLQKDLAREKRGREKGRKEVEKEMEMERSALKRITENDSNNERELELQRQLDDLRIELAREKREGERARKEIEKELEVERRTSKLAAEKNNISKNGDVELQKHLEELQTQLNHEKRENENARKEADKDLNMSETRKTVLESKLDQMRTKLRATKLELKECQTELNRVRTGADRIGISSMQGTDAPAQNSRKRPVMEISSDIAIGTPGVVRGKRLAVKRGKVDQTTVGEKSMFSITPYLNRTMSIAPESPGRNEHNEAAASESVLDKIRTADGLQSEDDHEEQLAHDKSPSAPSKNKAKSRSMEKKVLGESKQAVNSKKPAHKKSQIISTLAIVTEEDNNENEEPDKASRISNSGIAKPSVPKALKAQTKCAEETEPKKKKRKLLGGGKTLFDEEDAEATKKPTKVALGSVRLPGKGGLVGPMKSGMAAASGFGAFSPLKKDRRGIGASFLS